MCLCQSEKLVLFANGAKAVPRLQIPAYQWWSEALHGVGGSPGVSFSPPFSNATSFPQVSTWFPHHPLFNPLEWSACFRVLCCVLLVRIGCDDVGDLQRLSVEYDR